MNRNPNQNQFRISSFWGFGFAWIRESFPPNIQGYGDNSTRMSDILQDSTVVQRSVPVHGSTQLGLRSHPPGSITHEAPTTTFSFIKSDKPVYSTLSIRLLSSFHRNEAMTGPIVSHIRNPYPTISGGIHDFHASTQCWGAHMGDSQIVGVWTRSISVCWSSRQ